MFIHGRILLTYFRKAFQIIIKTFNSDDTHCMNNPQELSWTLKHVNVRDKV